MTTQAPQLDGRLIPIVRLAVYGLAGGNIADELGELNRIARALLASFGHANIIAQTCGCVSSADDFKLTHYPAPPPLRSNGGDPVISSGPALAVYVNVPVV